MRRIALGIMVMALVVPALPAAAIDIHDADVFGPGEAWPTPILRPGGHGDWVAELQVALNESGFSAGTVDGVYGGRTVTAVHAFQKLHDLPRDAVFLPDYWDLLRVPIPTPGVEGESRRIEVDLDRQLLFLIGDDSVQTVFSISSGNGQAYVNSRGNTVAARTPEGRFEFYNHISGWRISYLGGLYNPFYFRGGYAIHGSSSVPAYPASHGCVRVQLDDMDWLKQQLEIGMPIYVYGQRKTRAEVFA